MIIAVPDDPTPRGNMSPLLSLHPRKILSICPARTSINHTLFLWSFFQMMLWIAFMNVTNNSKRSNEKIVSYFTDRILSGELTPGEKLPSEHDLCAHFSVSRAVIREAIQQLKTRGLIVTVNGKGSYVTESGMEHFQDALQIYSLRSGGVGDWRELLSLRSLIETECARGVAKSGDPSKLDQVRKFLDIMRENQHDLKKFAEADIQFHQAIVKVFGNQLYAVVSTSLQGGRLRFAQETYRKKQVTRALEEHIKIYEAMAAGQVDAAGQAMVDHLLNARNNLEETLGDQ